ncbi:MAG: GNAT family N-acetyltransferase [Oligoflexia bacterium]|nr:GNAT family N-acetyltransferase [Oligoflexia bacterium]
MAADLTVTQITQGSGPVCNSLLRSLPLWFGIENAIQQYVKDVEGMPTFVAYMKEEPVGFVSLNLHNEYTAEVHVMAVHPDFHRKGVGRRLLNEAESFLREREFQFLSVKTLSPSRPNREYEQTRKFYFSAGFRPVEEFKNLWGDANPCLLLIKFLSAPSF